MPSAERGELKFEHFEEIEAWKKARELAGEIYRATREGPIAKDFGLRDQIRRAAGWMRRSA